MKVDERRIQQKKKAPETITPRKPFSMCCD